MELLLNSAKASAANAAAPEPPHDWLPGCQYFSLPHLPALPDSTKRTNNLTRSYPPSSRYDSSLILLTAEREDRRKMTN